MRVELLEMNNSDNDDACSWDCSKHGRDDELKLARGGLKEVNRNLGGTLR